MAFETTRSSKMAIVEETTEGTPIFPTLATDYLLLQEGFELIPAFETIENAELSGIIGSSATVQGLESPTGSMAHYHRHSGVEGTAPDYNLLLKSFMGAETSNATERTTTVGSTVSVVELAAGGSDFARGFAVLVKEAPYSIRNVTSVATDALTLAQDLGTAPATGIDVGKCVNYTLTDAGIPLSVFDYRADGGALQLQSGAKVDSMTINIPAADAINTDFSWVSTKHYMDPLEVTSTSNKLDFTDDTGTFAVSVTAKVYTDPVELASALETAINAATVETMSVTFNKTGASAGKYTIATSTSAVLSLLWKTGVSGADNTDEHIGSLLGYSDAADDTAATTYTSDTELSWAAPQTPTTDSTDFLVAKNNELIIGGSTEVTCVDSASVTVNGSKEASDVLSICAESGKSSTIFNGREITVDVVAYLEKHDVSKWVNFRQNDTVVFTYNGGTKTASNWDAGKCINIHMPAAKITEFALQDLDGIVTMEMTLQAFVSSGNPEFYLNFL